MPSQGEAVFTLTPGRVFFFARQPRVSQPVHPAGRGSGGMTGELQQGDNAHVLASSTLEIMMAEISSLKLALAQRGTIAPEVRYYREAWGWGKCACVHGIADGMEKDSVGTPHGTVPWNTSATRGRTMEHGGYYTALTQRHVFLELLIIIICCENPHYHAAFRIYQP